MVQFLANMLYYVPKAYWFTRVIHTYTVHVHTHTLSVHYKEYLVNIINKHGLDPVTMYETLKIKLMLTREEIAVPEQEDDEDNQQYREILIQVALVVE